MRQTKRSEHFLVCLLFNMLLNWEGIIPAVVLFILHRCLGWSVWWAVLALVVWIASLIVWMLVIGWATKCSNTPDRPTENKNPYSAGRSDR